jgi:hypothetical protein
MSTEYQLLYSLSLPFELYCTSFSSEMVSAVYCHTILPLQDKYDITTKLEYDTLIFTVVNRSVIHDSVGVVCTYTMAT